MWKRLRKNVNNWMFEEVPEKDPQEKPKSSSTKHQRPLQAKMMYQYPKEAPFRFPVIPDDDDHEDSPNAPAYRRRNRHERVKRVKRVGQMDTPIEFERVAFKQRQKMKEIQEIPAFMRKKDQLEEIIEPTEDTPVEREVESTYRPIKPHTKPDELDAVFKKRDGVYVDKELPTRQVELHKDEQVTDRDNRVCPEENREELATSSMGEISPLVPNLEEPEELIPSPIRQEENREKLPVKRKEVIKPLVNRVEEAEQPIHSFEEKSDSIKREEYIQVAQEQRSFQQPVVVTAIKEVPHYLLNDPIESDRDEDEQWINEQIHLLEQTLKHFNVDAQVVNATQGSSVTRFEVQPKMGVKVSRIRNLADDIKLNMAAKDIRIEAPIPGRHTVGIEVPNREAQMVGLQEIIESEAFRESTSPLSIALGLTIEGEPLVTTVGKMPHGLIAGATGSGKSVCINTILLSLMYKASHEEVKFLLIDPKMVELAPYNGVPHLVSPVITDIKAATAALKWAVNEMEERYQSFAESRVRDISRYNTKVEMGSIDGEKMPYIVIVIDELADLMMASPQDVEDSICRIAQKARACGIHLLLATQRPSVDVITGLIKANIPTRIAFSVTSQIDSRTMIDTNGAEKLLGKGDMLFVENGSSEIVRLQGPFVSDDEIERVTSYVRSIAEPTYLFEQEQLLQEMVQDEEEDEILEEVIHFVVDHNQASTSLLQRRFRIGYNRAARLIDTLEARGIISEQNGTKPRDVLITKSQIEELG